MTKVNFSGLFDHVSAGGYSLGRLVGSNGLRGGLRRLMRNRAGSQVLRAQIDALNGSAVGAENVTVTRTRIAARTERTEPTIGIIPIETVTVVDRPSNTDDQTTVQETFVEHNEVTFPENASNDTRVIQ